MQRLRFGWHLYGMAQVALDLIENSAGASVLSFQVGCIEMKMCNGAYAVLYVVKDQHGFGEAHDGQGQIQRLEFRHRDTLEAGYGFVCQVANTAAVKLG